MNANQKLVAQYVSQARRQNTMHVKSLVLGYSTAEFDFTVKRNALMKLARQVKANPNLGVRL